LLLSLVLAGTASANAQEKIKLQGSSPLQSAGPAQYSSPLQNTGPMQGDHPLQSSSPLQNAGPLSLAAPLQSVIPPILPETLEFSEIPILIPSNEILTFEDYLIPTSELAVLLKETLDAPSPQVLEQAVSQLTNSVSIINPVPSTSSFPVLSLPPQNRTSGS